MVGAAVRGISKILRKGLKKAPVLGKYARGTPTKAGLVARRAALRGETKKEGANKKAYKTADRVMRDAGIKGAVTMFGAGAIAGRNLKVQIDKEAKAEAKTRKKLTKSVEEHKKKTKEKKEKRERK